MKVVKNDNNREVKNQMKVVKTDNNNNNHKRAMTLAELEALAQFVEASDREGQAVFHPWVGPDSLAPHYVVLPEDLTRIVGGAGPAAAP